MAKGKVKEGRLHKVRDASWEDCQKKKVKSDGKCNEKGNKKQSSTETKLKANYVHSVAKSPDENCLIKGAKKRREDREQNAVEAPDSSNARKEEMVKHFTEIGRSQDEKLQGASEGCASFYKDGNLKNSDLGSKKKKKEVREHHSEKLQFYAVKEQSNNKHDEKVKKPKVENDDERKKMKQAKKGFGEDDMVSGESSVDYHTKKRKWKAEPKNILDAGSNEKVDIEMLGLDHGEVSEDTCIVKKKKKKKLEHESEQDSKSALHPALDYLHTWHTDRKNWKFKKVRQVWLLQNMFDQEQIADEDFSILLRYLEGLKGGAKDKTIEVAERKIESKTGEQDSVVDSRVRQVLQLLTE